MDNRLQISNWSHAPAHKLLERGTYMVTAGTYQKEHLFTTPEKLDFLMSECFHWAAEFGWQPQAWAFMRNHYHVILLSPEQPSTLPELIRNVHRTTGMRINEEDQAPGRQVWYQYWDKRLTFQASLYPRLKYVHQNAARHGIVRNAEEYPWCSAAWFKRSAEPAFQKMVEKFKTDQLKEFDEF